jgi:predicted aldo/keto reductase-like oxidoreductase
MQYRKLGNTGLMVSEIALGGEWLERKSEEQVFAVVDAARKCGINLLDCFMSEPNVRSNLGNAIKGEREKWIIQGHLGSAWRSGRYLRVRDIPSIEAAFEDLLTRFHTDYIDLGMIHFVDRLDDWQVVLEGGFMDYMIEQKRFGRVRQIGLSTHNVEIARMAVEHGVVEVLLYSVNPGYDLLVDLPAEQDSIPDPNAPALLGMDPARALFYDLCEKRGVGINVMKCFGGGRLLDAERSPFGVALTVPQCIHYCLTRPAVASVMLGFETAEQVYDAIRYASATDDECDYAAPILNASRSTYFGHCTYCGHCQPCHKNVDIAMINKLYDLAIQHDETPATVQEHYYALSAHASDCIHCGLCETRCPFHVRVAEHMKTVAAYFGK